MKTNPVKGVGQKEMHRSGRAGWLRAAVLGSNDSDRRDRAHSRRFRGVVSCLESQIQRNVKSTDKSLTEHYWRGIYGKNNIGKLES